MRMRAFALAGAFAAAAWLVGCSGSGTTAIAPMPNRPATAADVVPSPTPTPIQLAPGGVVGDQVFPEGDTATGGQGQQVDTVNCRAFLDNAFHHHVHLAMFVNGEQIGLPRGTGMKHPGVSSFIYHATCYYFLHTHDGTGIIHIEPPISETFTLHQYFGIWGQPLSTTGFAGYSGAVTVYINGAAQAAGTDPNAIALTPFEEITLVIGAPPAWIPAYAFPANYP